MAFSPSTPPAKYACKSWGCHFPPVRSTRSHRDWTRRVCSRPRVARLLNLDNLRRREWTPAVEASGVQSPARIYDLRSTFASNALAAGVGIHALARIMGTSVAMIERHYGTLLDGAMESITGRLDAFDAEHEQVAVED